VSPEALDEVTLIGEADCDGNFGHRPIAFAEQLSSQLDATTLEIPHGCHTGAGSKQADETKAAGSRQATQFIESDMFSDVIVHVAHDRSKGRRVQPSYRIIAWTRAGIVVANQLRGQHRRDALHKEALSGMLGLDELCAKNGCTVTDHWIIHVEYRHEIDCAGAADLRHRFDDQPL
jgi:hypothetical protein